jgi:hypothetical protein
MSSWPTHPFTRAELAQLDLTESDLRRGQRTGEIRAVVRGVLSSARAVTRSSCAPAH